MTKDVLLESPFNNVTYIHLEAQQGPANGEVKDEVDDQGQQGGEYHEGPERGKRQIQVRIDPTRFDLGSAVVLKYEIQVCRFFFLKYFVSV